MCVHVVIKQVWLGLNIIYYTLNTSQAYHIIPKIPQAIAVAQAYTQLSAYVWNHIEMPAEIWDKASYRTYSRYVNT